jgi:peptidyl-dipeptidase A
MVVLACVLVASTGCRRAEAPGRTETGDTSNVTGFLADANAKLLKLINEANEAGWVLGTYITVDTQAISARADEAYVNASTDYAKRAARFPADAGSPEERRQLNVLKNTMTMAGPADPKKTTELTTISSRMAAAYGSGKYCPPGAEGQEACLDVEAVTKVLAESRDPKKLREVWEGWHSIGPGMKQDYARFVELSNEGAKEVGFADTGAMWRSRYDMAPDAFAKELDRLWSQLQPLYLSLHAHVRAKLHEKYGNEVPAEGPIPAYLLGNIWAQDWSNVYALVAPAGMKKAVPLDDILKQRKVQPLEMARIAERFFTSLGFDPLPKTFYERSLFVKPKDREVVCHASAWDINSVDDLRIKMCIDPTEEDFITIHHELGHNFYQRAYAQLPVILRDSANDGFHEAIGDTIALSVTPEYLVKIGMINQAPDAVVPAVRSGHRPVALARLQRGGQARRLQRDVVGPSSEVSGHCRADHAWGGVLRSGREVSRAEQHAIRAVFPRGGVAVPVPPRPGEDGRLHDRAPSLLDLRQQGSGRTPEEGAGHGCVKAVARGARSTDRPARDGCLGDSGLLRAAQEVA